MIIAAVLLLDHRHTETQTVQCHPSNAAYVFARLVARGDRSRNILARNAHCKRKRFLVEAYLHVLSSPAMPSFAAHRPEEAGGSSPWILSFLSSLNSWCNQGQNSSPFFSKLEKLKLSKKVFKSE